MSLTFASNLTKLIDAGLGGEMVAPDTSVAIGYRMQYNLVSGPVASWNDPEGGLPVNIVTEFGPIQAGSGDPSPENVRPISGRTAVDIYRSEYNLLDQSIVLQASGWALSTDEGFETYGGVPVYKGTSRALYNRFNNGRYVPLHVDPSKRYIIGYYWRSVNEHTQSGLRMGIMYDDGTVDVTGQQSANLTWTRRVLGTAEGKTPIGVRFSYNSDYAIYLAGFFCMDYDQYYALGDDRLTFVCPGDRTAVTIPFGDTIYGGSLDVTTGVLTVQWANIASYGGETLPGEWISDRDVYAPGTTPTTGAQVCYKLAESLTIQLSAQTIKTLKGQNNIWSDAGDVSVTWKEKLYTEGY